MHIGENIDIGRKYNFRKPKRYTKFLKRKCKTVYKKWHFQTRYEKLRKFWIKKKRNQEKKRQYKCYLCGPEDLIRSECPKLKKLLNKQGKIQVKINLIREHQINSKEKELISE